MGATSIFIGPREFVLKVVWGSDFTEREGLKSPD
jgi:hypothetical protein